MNTNFRHQQDEKLFNEISLLPTIQRSANLLQELEKKNPKQNTKKHLLSTSLRLSKIISPSLHKMSDQCTKVLDIQLPVELFVYSSSNFNAACFKPEDNKLYIMFSSSLLEAFSEDELCYVLGHELGHHKYSHHSLPIQFLLKHNKEINTTLALKLFKWSRFAEISADRAGAMCIKNFEAVASALFKLSSGLSHFKTVKFDIKEYIKQIDELIHNHKNSHLESDLSDWFSSHPFSPLRVKALQHFFNSNALCSNGLSLEETDTQVENTLSFMDPDYLKGGTPANKACRDVFIAAAICISHLDGDFSKEEKKKLNQMLDNDLNIEALNKELLEKDLPARIDKANSKSSSFQKRQLLRDLSVLVENTGNENNTEIQFLSNIASQLKVSPDFISNELSKKTELD